jgi:hypothetical protein
MPINNPAPSGSGGFTIDEDGYVVVPGHPFPFKDTEEDLGGGLIRLHHMIKHPVLGEVSVAFNDHQT